MTPPTDPSYTAQALRTESPITPALQTRLRDNPRLVHAVLGLQTEAGELADPVKKHIYYGRPLDPVNLREEIGDCLWYLAIACDALGTTLEVEQARNLAKLRARYPHVFTAEAAQVRDLDRERQVLEGAEVETLRGAMRADDQRLRDAEERVWPGETRGCDAPDAMADEILHLRQQLDAARAETVEIRKRLNDRAELAELDAGTTEPAPATEPARCEECDRLRRFAAAVKDAYFSSTPANCMSMMRAALAHFQSNSSVITGSPEPEGGQ